MALIQCDFYSNVIGMDMSLNVIIPNTRYAGEKKPEKVLYLLHGRSDDYTKWQRFTRVEAFAEQYQICVVMPAAHRSFYTDMASGERFYTYISQEVPQVARALFGFSEKKEDNFIAGLSMGGYGALKIAMRNPERFAATASMSGVTDIFRFMRENTDSVELKSIFGDITQVRPEDDLFALAKKTVEQKSALQFYLACGTEDYLYQDNIKFRDFCAEIGLNHIYEEGPGEHNWTFWNEYIEKIMKWISEM